MSSQFDILYERLQDYLIDIEIKYIEPHSNPIESPIEYEFDVRSYCVLSHAAFEEFAESITIMIMDDAISNFKNLQRMSYPLILLIHFKGLQPNDIKDNTTYDYLLKLLDDIKEHFSNEIMVNNHGVSLKYLKNLFVPVGIDIPQDINMRNSLEQLAIARGSYAHNFSSNRIKKSLTPEDAAKYVSDVNLMMKQVLDSAKKIPYYKYR